VSRFARAALVLAGAIGLLLVVLVVRAALLPSQQVAVEPMGGLVIDAEAAAERLAQAVRIPTVSHQDPSADDQEAFASFRSWMESTYPRVHAALTHERFAGASLLHTWPGRDPALAPILLVAHQDVVPAVEPERWSQPPFSGARVDGHVWGRGSLDDKGSLVGILEAVEGLLSTGFEPQRTVLLAFGHDEEVAGTGARAIAEALKTRGIRPQFALDEGMVITDGIVPGLSAPAALIGLSEKGYLTVDLVVRAQSGHSSMPPRKTAVSILANAVARVAERPPPGALDGPVQGMFAALGPEMGFANRLVFANLWLFEPLVRRKLAANSGTDAILRTTVAPTMLQASHKENVLATEARATLNFRLHPRDDQAGILRWLRERVDDERVGIEPHTRFSSEPSPVADVDGPGYAAIERSIRQVAPEVLVAPGLVLAATDSRHYGDVAEDVYRFAPAWTRPEDRERYHGVDERMAVDNFALCIRFYDRLIRNAAGANHQTRRTPWEH
jgi:carboxypeptidase PM20D1